MKTFVQSYLRINLHLYLLMTRVPVTLEDNVYKREPSRLSREHRSINIFKRIEKRESLIGGANTDIDRLHIAFSIKSERKQNAKAQQYDSHAYASRQFRHPVTLNYSSASLSPNAVKAKF